MTKARQLSCLRQSRANKTNCAKYKKRQLQSKRKKFAQDRANSTLALGRVARVCSQKQRRILHSNECAKTNLKRRVCFAFVCRCVVCTSLLAYSFAVLQSRLTNKMQVAPTNEREFATLKLRFCLGENCAQQSKAKQRNSTQAKQRKKLELFFNESLETLHFVIILHAFCVVKISLVCISILRLTCTSLAVFSIPRLLLEFNSNSFVTRSIHLQIAALRQRRTWQGT